MMVSAPIMIIGGLIMALRQDVPLTGILLVIVPIMVVIIGLLVRRALPLFQAMQVKIDRINQVMRETLAGVRVIRAFVRTDYEERRFDEANRDLFETALSVNRLFAIMMPTLMVIMNLTTVAVLWFGAFRVESGEMSIGNLTAFLQYIIQILFAIMMATFMFVIVPRAAVSSERISEVLATEPSIHDPADPISPPRTGSVEFRDVEFGYPGAEEPVLRAISFTAGSGETTAIVGSTGSGKSTLVNLLPRLYDVTGGSVLVDGVDVRAMDRADLWSRIGLIPQRAFLFGGTVASNLRFGDEAASDEDLWHALEIAQGREFVEEMPEGLEAPVAQGGTNVSGGQRQRLAIARALVKRPQIYIFDDSFSALDFRTDARLRAALAHDLAEATVIIVAQRVGTILHADRIVVLDDGGVVGDRHPRRSSWPRARPTARSSSRSSPRRRSRERAGHGPRAGRRAAAAAARPRRPRRRAHGVRRDARREATQLPGVLPAPARRAGPGAAARRAGHGLRDRQRLLRDHRPQDPRQRHGHHLRGRGRQAAARRG